MSNINIQQIQKATRQTPAVCLVIQNNAVIGMLEKYSDTRTDHHPWKAFSGTGEHREYLGAYYPAEGGKAASIDKILGGK